jgi:D-proline reductase (dithiol) PrdB
MQGIPTVLVTVFPEESRQAGPPRAIHPVDFKPGNSFGGPFDNDLQSDVLYDALRRLQSREEPGHIWDIDYFKDDIDPANWQLF